MQKGSTAVDPTQDWEATEAVGFFTIYNVYSRMYSNIKLHTWSLNFSVYPRWLVKTYWKSSGDPNNSFSLKICKSVGLFLNVHDWAWEEIQMLQVT